MEILNHASLDPNFIIEHASRIFPETKARIQSFVDTPRPYLFTSAAVINYALKYPGKNTEVLRERVGSGVYEDIKELFNNEDADPELVDALVSEESSRNLLGVLTEHIYADYITSQYAKPAVIKRMISEARSWRQQDKKIVVYAAYLRCSYVEPSIIKQLIAEASSFVEVKTKCAVYVAYMAYPYARMNVIKQMLEEARKWKGCAYQRLLIHAAYIKRSDTELALAKQLVMATNNVELTRKYFVYVAYMNRPDADPKLIAQLVQEVMSSPVQFGDANAREEIYAAYMNRADADDEVIENIFREITQPALTFNDKKKAICIAYLQRPNISERPLKVMFHGLSNLSEWQQDIAWAFCQRPDVNESFMFVHYRDRFNRNFGNRHWDDDYV